MGPLIRASSLRGFDLLVCELGGDPGALLTRFGLPVETLASDSELIPITAHDLMLDATARELNCPDFGLRLAASQDLSILGPLALAIEASSTVAQALACASRYMFVHSPALKIGIEREPGGRRGAIAITYRKDLAESSYSPQAIELGVGLFHHVATQLLGTASGLRSVHLPHPPISPIRTYLDFFGVPDVRFGMPHAALVVNASVLDHQFDGADSRIRELALKHLAKHFPDPSTRLSDRVRRTLAESLGVSSASLADIARLFSLHPRTVQRRLAQEGTSYDALLDGVRREAAHRYLTTTDLPLTQVAALVGFSEHSSLTHAVRRWHGISPRRLRDESVVTLSR